MCYRPITIKNPATGKYMQVPCGRCLDCKRKYQNALSNRMYEEFKAKGFKGVFFTLTYNENSVPKNYLAAGNIYRSRPDYSFSNLHEIDGKLRPCAWNERLAKWEPCRARKKWSEKPYKVLIDDGVPCVEFEDFNKIRSRKERDLWFKSMSQFFLQFDENNFMVASRGTDSAIVPHDFDLETESFEFFFDKDTGELDYRAASIDEPEKIFDYEAIRNWYLSETPVISFNSVRIEDVQLWLKRNSSRSKRDNENFDFSYFITSEYGPRTLRPHYHGVLFGVTKDDVRSWFRDWQRHYGEIVDFDNLDPTKGGLSYVSKYCSKGVFEHPLCARDFFYKYRRANSYEEVVCNEYHSKHFERCIEYFGFDAPIVDCTFHLFSKGLGKDFLKHNSFRCQEFEDIAGKFDCPFVFHNSLKQLSEKFVLEFASDAPDIDSFYRNLYELADYRWKGYEEEWLRCFSRRFRFWRNTRIKDKKTGFFKEVVLGYAVPRYYRSKLFGPKLQSSYSNFIQSENDRLSRQKFNYVASCYPSRSDVQIAAALASQERQEIIDRFNKCFDSQKRFFDKAKL